MTSSDLDCTTHDAHFCKIGAMPCQDPPMPVHPAHLGHVQYQDLRLYQAIQTKCAGHVGPQRECTKLPALGHLVCRDVWRQLKISDTFAHTHVEGFGFPLNFHALSHHLLLKRRQVAERCCNRHGLKTSSSRVLSDFHDMPLLNLRPSCNTRHAGSIGLTSMALPAICVRDPSSKEGLSKVCCFLTILAGQMS